MITEADVNQISYCGLDCSKCTVLIAGKETDKSRKEVLVNEIINKCRELYGINYKFDDINICDGCKAETGRIFSGCINCGIRKCAIEKKISSCAFCDDYPCTLLLKFFEADPEARSRLDAVRSNQSHGK
jgi:hypothetical protein